jgi:predicted amidohydrolase
MSTSQDFESQIKSLFEKWLGVAYFDAENSIKEVGLGSKLLKPDAELVTRVYKFELEVFLRKQREGFDIQFKVINLKDENQSTKDFVRIVAVQIDAPQFSSTVVPLNFSQESIPQRVERIKNVVNMILIHNSRAEKIVDFLCFPELSVPMLMVDSIVGLLKKTCAPYVLAGFEYEGLRNPCKVFCEGRVYSQHKTSPSKFEDSKYDEKPMERGKVIYIFRTVRGNFAVLICNEYMDARSSYLDLLGGKLKALFPNDFLNMIFVLSQNPKPNDFLKWAEGDADKMGCHVILCNTSDYGCTSVVSPQNVTQGQAYNLPKDQQNLLCEELDVRIMPVIMALAIAKKGVFYTHLFDLEAPTKKEEILLS